jgi:hypothetical protein
MRFACWINKAADTYSEYLILIAYPRQQRLHELSSMLRYNYIASFVVAFLCMRNHSESAYSSLHAFPCFVHLEYWYMPS